MRNLPIHKGENSRAREQSKRKTNHKELIFFTFRPFEVNLSRKILEMIPKGFLRLRTLLHTEKKNHRAIIVD
jgi:hypothetical protein